MTREYEFTNAWSVGLQPTMMMLLAHLVGRPDARILEVGSYEGRAACWLLDNVLTGDGAQLTCIEPFRDYADRPGDDWTAIRARWTKNTDGRARLFDRLSDFAASTFYDGEDHPFDAAFIDGDHSAAAVLSDAVRAFDLLKPGGILMFDDFDWDRTGGAKEDIPRTAILAFLSCYRWRCEPVGDGTKMIAVRKL